MSTYVFFNPELVESLAARGITARRRASDQPPQGFVLGGRATRAQVPRTVTHRIGTHGSVTITAQRLLADGRPGGTGGETSALGERPGIAGAETSPQTALELVMECERLRQDNQRLTTEVSQLRAEVDRLTTQSSRAVDRFIPEDDTARRFALLELD